MIYVDSSAITSILLSQSAYPNLQSRLMRGGLFSSLLLEAEVFSALRRESLSFEEFDQFRELILWIKPTRPLQPEITEVLRRAYLRGADAFHLASAIYAFKNRQDVEFCSLDKSQRSAAETCGFKLFPHHL
jgi:predicted nucleic acid-binding protein